MDRRSRSVRPMRRSEMAGMVVAVIADAMVDFLGSQAISPERRTLLLERFHHELALGDGQLPPASGPRRAPRHPVDSTVVNHAVAVVAEELGVDAIGVELGRRVPWGGMGFLDTITFASENLGAALGHVVKHYGAITSTVSLRLERRTRSGERELVHLVQEQKSDDDDITHIIDFAFAFCLARARAAVVGAVELEGVSLRRRASRSAAETHRAFFGVTPAYEARENAFVLEPTTLELPLRSPNPTLVEVIDANARLFVSSAREGLGQRLTVVVARHLDRTGEVLGVGAAAKAMGLSGRTLQSRLADLGTTFADLVDGVRREKALRLVRSGGAPLTEVAFALGFRSPASFSRAFRRWTGTSPSDARRSVEPPPRSG